MPARPVSSVKATYPTRTGPLVDKSNCLAPDTLALAFPVLPCPEVLTFTWNELPTGEVGKPSNGNPSVFEMEADADIRLPGDPAVTPHADGFVCVIVVLPWVAEHVVLVITSAVAGIEIRSNASEPANLFMWNLSGRERNI